MSTASIEMEVGFGPISEADALAAVRRIVDEGRISPEAQQTKGMAPEHRMYWKVSPSPRRQPLKNKAGWILIGVSPRTHKSDAEVAQFSRNKEARPLDEFGEYPGSAQRNPLCANWGPEHPYGPYTELFLKPGGVQAMPIAQHISIGSHRRPELVAILPELANVKDQPCPHKCTNDDGTVRLFVSQAAVNQHVEAIHKRDQGVIQGMEAVAQVIKENQFNPAEFAQALLVAVQMLQQGQIPIPTPTPTAGTTFVNPERNSWPEFIPATEESATPDKSFDEMARGELLSLISQNQIPIPDGRKPFSLTRDEALAIVKAHISGQ